EADLVRDGQDAFSGRRRDAGLPVEGKRHGRLGDARPPRYVGDRRALPSGPPLTLNRYSASIRYMRRNAAKIISGTQPVNWLGANFWSRTGGPLMWRTYDPAVVSTELSVLRDHGLSMTRSFFYWPDFMPAPDRIDEELTARFADFLDRHSALGMSTVPTFIVGHMSGDNWDPAWRAGRHLYTDVWMVGRQAWFAGEMVRRFGPHPAVAGWLVSNEMPIYGGKDSPPEVVATWAQLIRDAVRAAGGHQPFSLGDGAWGIEVRGV